MGKVDGREYACSEDYFHAQKPKPFSDAEWLPKRVGVMRKGVRAKFMGPGNVSAELRALLTSTHPHPLRSVKPDDFWGFHPAKGGADMLEKLLMELREELVAGQ